MAEYKYTTKEDYKDITREHLLKTYKDHVAKDMEQMSRPEKIQYLLNMDRVAYEDMLDEKLASACVDRKLRGVSKYKKDKLIETLKKLNIPHVPDAAESAKKRKKRRKKKKVQKEPIPKRVRDELWRTTFGKLDGKCYTCKGPIGFESFEAGHIIAEAKGGSNNIDNLVPVCSPCNRSMGTRNMHKFGELLERKPMSAANPVAVRA